MDSSSMDLTATCDTVDAKKAELLSLRDKNEVIFQENYELRKKIEIVERLNLDLESEVIFLNNAKIKEKSEMSNLQNDLQISNAKIKQLQSQMEDDRLHFQDLLKEAKESKVTESKPPIVPDQEQLNILTKQILNLEVLRDNDQILIKELVHEKTSTDCMIKALKDQKQILQEELSDTKQHLHHKTKDLQNSNESLESMREEKLLLSTELQLLKASDSNAERGNSLFAEVEDNRQKVVAQREILKLKYINLKKVVSQKQVENNKLKLEIVKMKREEKEDEKSIHRDYTILINTYKIRVSELEDRVRSLEMKCGQPPIPMPNTESNWVNTVVEDARKEARSLQTELDRRGSNYVIQGHQLFDSQKENRKLRGTILKLQSDVDELRLKLDTIKSANEEVDDGISPPATDVAVAYQKQKIVKLKEALVERNNVSFKRNQANDSNEDVNNSKEDVNNSKEEVKNSKEDKENLLV